MAMIDDRSLELIGRSPAAPERGMSLADVLDVLLTAPERDWRDLFLTVHEAAHMADMDVHTVRQWLRDGVVRGYRDRGQLFVLAESLRSVVDS